MKQRYHYKESKQPKTMMLTAGLFILLHFLLPTSIRPTAFEGKVIENLPNNPLEGRQVFIDKGCIQCHTVWGEGEAFGPDLTHTGKDREFTDLAGALWSHSPKMMEFMNEKDIPIPKLSPEETRNLLAYLYYLGLFDETGDPLKGRNIYSIKNCDRCHSVGKAERRKIPLDKYGRYISPIYIAAALWNHGSKAGRGMLKQTFAEGEMADLLAFIRKNAEAPSGETVYMKPGNPNAGSLVFNQKKCVLCHGEKGRNFKGKDLRKSMTGIIGTMWNHSDTMWEIMRARGIRVPQFKDKEMADLVTFLYFIPFYGGKGNPEDGKTVFEEKGCAACHGKEGVEAGKGIDLAAVADLPVFELISVMWNHLPEMIKRVTGSHLLWPTFAKGEMRNLIAFMRAFHLMPHSSTKGIEIQLH